MAAEITINQSISATKGGTKINQQTISVQVDWSSEDFAWQSQDIPTSHTALVVPASVTNLGWAQFRNLDPTNWIEVGVVVSGTFYPFLRLLPGEPGTMPLSPSATIYAKANAATVKLNYLIMER